MKKYICGMILFCITLFGCAKQDLKGYACRIHFIDTGNSDCILIESDKNVLIDAGDDAHQDEVIEYIQGLGIHSLDYVINTHPDADHCGGLDKIVDTFTIGQVFVGNGDSETYTYEKFIESLVNAKLYPAVPLEKSKIEIGEDTTIEFYNTKNEYEDVNDTSLVVLLNSQGKKALFTGDITYKAENELLDELCKVDILKVAHHGSRYSTSSTFLDVISPKYAIICTGENSYGHPNMDVIQRLEDAHVQIYRTDQDGAIIVSIGNHSIYIESNKLDK